MLPRTIRPAVALSLVFGLAAGRTGSAAETYAADPVHSSTIYRVKHLNTSYSWGRFDDIAGTFTLDESNPAESFFGFQIKADSIDSGNAARDKHLKGPDFFNVVQFPTIVFKSQSITKAGDAYQVTGDLTLHGVTKPLTLKVVPTGKGKNQKGTPIAGIESSFQIKRSDFGMSNMVGPLGDDVTVYVSIEGARR